MMKTSLRVNKILRRTGLTLGEFQSLFGNTNILPTSRLRLVESTAIEEKEAPEYELTPNTITPMIEDLSLEELITLKNTIHLVAHNKIVSLREKLENPDNLLGDLPF